MGNIGILNSKILDLPLERNDEYFPLFINNFFNSYLKLVEEFDGSLCDKISEHKNTIIDLTSELTESINYYYIGKTQQSFELFEKAVNLIEKFLLIQNTIVVPKCSNAQKITQEFFFRVRSNKTQMYSKKEMFMRPFEDRELIPTYRYSIPGLPCIYLSNKIYTAWCELDCPDINTLQASRFEIDNSLLRLHFAINIDLLKINFDENNISDILLHYLIYFPLHAACTIKVKNYNAVFKPEYIFPQFLMQWVKKKGIDIIEYMSAKANHNVYRKNSSFNVFNNYAIPAKTSNATGICSELESKIKLTESISWQALNITNPKLILEPRNNNSHNMIRLFNSVLEVELISGIKVPYNDTAFGIMEEFLIDKMQADSLK